MYEYSSVSFLGLKIILVAVREHSGPIRQDAGGYYGIRGQFLITAHESTGSADHRFCFSRVALSSSCILARLVVGHDHWHLGCNCYDVQGLEGLFDQVPRP